MRLKFRRKHRWLKRSLLAITLVLAGFAALMLVVPVFVQAGLNAALRQSGFAAATYERLRLGLDSAEIEGLRLDDAGAARIGRIKINYVLSDLLQGRVGSVQVQDAQLTLQLDTSGFSIPGFTPPDKKTDARAQALPFAQFTLTESRLLVKTPLGDIDSLVTAQADRQDQDLQWILALTAKGLPVTYQFQANGLTRPLAAGLSHDIALSLPLWESDIVSFKNFSGQLVLAPLQGKAPQLKMSGRGDAFQLFGLHLPMAAGVLTADDGNIVWQAQGGTPEKSEPEKSAPQKGQQTEPAFKLDWRHGPALPAWGVGQLRLMLPAQKLNVADKQKGQAASNLSESNKGAGKIIFDLPAAGSATVQVDLQNIILPHGSRLGSIEGIAALAKNAAGDLLLQGTSKDPPSLDCANIRIAQLELADWRLDKADFCLQGKVGKAGLQLSLGAPQLQWNNRENDAPMLNISATALAAEWQESLSVSAKNWRVHSPPAALELLGKDLKAILAPNLQMNLQAELRGTGSPAMLAPQPVHFEMNTEAGKTQLNGRLGGDAQAGKPLLSMEGEVAANGTGNIILLHAANWQTDGLSKATKPNAPQEYLDILSLSPLLAEHLDTFSGQSRARIALALQAKGFQGTAQLTLRNLKGEGAALAFTNLSTELEATSLQPLILRDGQKLNLEKMERPLPLEKISLEGGLRADGRLFIKEGGADFMGGRISLAPLLADISRPPFTPQLELTNIDLSQFLQQIQLDGLAGEGVLSGRLPLSLDSKGARIIDGVLEARAGGRLRYDPVQPPDFLSQAEKSGGLDVMRGALRDLRYEALTLNLNGDLLGRLDVGLKLAGANPQFQEGRAVKLNLNLSGDLAALFQRGQMLEALPDRILKKIQKKTP